MTTTTKVWLKGLLAATISAVSTAVSGVVVLPDVFNFTNAGLLNTAKLVIVPTVVAVCSYLKQSPVPVDSVTVDTSKTVSVTKN